MKVPKIEVIVRKDGLARPQGLLIDGVEMSGVKDVQVGYPLDAGARVVTVTFVAEFSEVEPEGVKK